MLLCFYLIFTFLFFFCFLSIAKLNSQSASSRSVFARSFGISVYTKLRNKITARDKRKYDKMNESAKKFSNKTKKRLKRLETHPDRVQKAQRDVPRYEVQILVNTAGFNLDSMVLLFKTIFVILFLLFYTYFTNFNYLFSIRNTRILCLFFSFWAVHITFHILILRQSRFWFWRQWPAVFQFYGKGYYPYRTGLIVFVLYFIPVIWVSVAVLVLGFLTVRLDQTYFRRYAYMVWGGFMRLHLWSFLGNSHVWYRKYLKPSVTFFTRITRPFIRRMRKKIPKFRLPHGYTWF